MLFGQFHEALLEMLREMLWRCGDAAQACSHMLSTIFVCSRQKTLVACILAAATVRQN